MRLKGAFVTKFYEEWKHAGDTMLKHRMGSVTQGEHRARVERFLEAMKYDLAAVLFENDIPFSPAPVPEAVFSYMKEFHKQAEAASGGAPAENKNSPSTQENT
jgi:hypothetical protein